MLSNLGWVGGHRRSCELNRWNRERNHCAYETLQRWRPASRIPSAVDYRRTSACCDRRWWPLCITGAPVRGSATKLCNREEEYKAEKIPKSQTQIFVRFHSVKINQSWFILMPNISLNIPNSNINPILMSVKFYNIRSLKKDLNNDCRKVMY
jgi:hypothetical protein